MSILILFKINEMIDIEAIKKKYCIINSRAKYLMKNMIMIKTLNLINPF